ncbi:MAG: hypothetical protein ABI112_05405, partial [Terracoccus sp.]
MPNVRRSPRRGIAAVIVLPVVLVAGCTASAPKAPPSGDAARPAASTSTPGQPSTTSPSGSSTNP